MFEELKPKRITEEATFTMYQDDSRKFKFLVQYFNRNRTESDGLYLEEDIFSELINGAISNVDGFEDYYHSNKPKRKRRNRKIDSQTNEAS